MTGHKTPRENLLTVLTRGLKCRCPKCGIGRLYRAFLKPVDTCNQCYEELGHIRSDDIPAYFTVLLVGHLVVPSVVLTEQMYHPSELVHFAIWIPLSVLLMFLFLPHIKGAMVGLLWRLRPTSSH